MGPPKSPECTKQDENTGQVFSEGVSCVIGVMQRDYLLNKSSKLGGGSGAGGGTPKYERGKQTFFSGAKGEKFLRWGGGSLLSHFVGSRGGHAN